LEYVLGGATSSQHAGLLRETAGDLFLLFLVAVAENDSSEVNAFDGGYLEGSRCYSTLHHTLLYTTIPS
jgi:hypothetical protein